MLSEKLELGSGRLLSEMASTKANHASSPVKQDSSPFVRHSWSPFLDRLTGLQQHSILGAATLCNYVTDSVVLNQGDSADRLLLLRTGCARIFFVTQDGRKVLLRWLSAGEVLGGTALLAEPTPYLVSTELLKKSSAFVWTRDAIRQLAAKYPVLLENALPFAWNYLAWFIAAHTALLANTARERLAQVITSLAEGIGRKVHSGIRLEVTNEQLANTANITPFTASRLLSEWQRSGAIRKGRGNMVLLDPELLLQTPQS